jgi:hypothetical protein
VQWDTILDGEIHANHYTQDQERADPHRSSKPDLGDQSGDMMGKATPPMDAPETVMPAARARHLKNQVMTLETVG